MCVVMKKRYKDMEFSLVDGIFAAALLVAGFLFWNWISLFRPGAGAAAFTVVICLITGIYLDRKGYRQNRRSLVCLVIIVLSAAVFLIFDSYLEKSLNLLLVMALFIYWVALITRSTIENRLSGCAMVDLVHQIFAKGFANFPSLPAVFAGNIRKRKNGKSITAALIGIVVMIPILCIIISLLINADVAFETLMKKISESISKDILIYVWYFILGIPVAFYLCSLTWGNMVNHPEVLAREQVDKSMSRFRIAPATSVYSALAMLNLIYVIFFISQAAYLFSAFASALPDGMTYAQYARRGFFELCGVAAINLGLLILAQLLIKKTGGKLLKIETVVLSIFTMLLTATGISKMILYIQSYGLTRLRVYTSIFMILLFLVFLIILLRQLGKFNTGRAVIIAALVCFAGLCFSNIDGQIAQYNMGQYLKGTLPLMDRDSMQELSAGAVPYLYDAYQKTDDEKAKTTLYAAITGEDLVSLMTRREDGAFKAYNLQLGKAMKIRQEIKKDPPAQWKALITKSREAGKVIKNGNYHDLKGGSALSMYMDEEGTFYLEEPAGYADGRYTVEKGKCVLHLNTNHMKVEDEVLDGATFTVDKNGNLILNQDLGDVLKKGTVLVFSN